MSRYTPVTLSLPSIIEVHDYHDFYVIAKVINMIVQSGHVEIIELGFNYDTSMYVGLVYERGAKPSKTDIKNMLKQKNIILDQE